MIRLERVSRAFQRPGGEPVFALKDLDLEILKGETMALLGPSGCGKTTTLRLLNRLLEPTSGKIFIGDEDTSSVDAVRLRRRTGYVVQRGGLFPHLTIHGNLTLLCELERWPKDRASKRAGELLELVGLPPDEFRDRYPTELSGGQRQRVGVARALAADPPLLLFDEPFGALDPVTRVELQRQFLTLRRSFQKTAIFVTHDVREALLLATRIGLLHNGHLEMLATPSEFVNAEGEEARAFLACLDWKMETDGFRSAQ